MKRWYVWVILLVLSGAGYWLYRNLSAPVPGQAVPDMGRQHVTPEEFAKITFNSNPPTSGSHLPIWVKAGIYDQPQTEGELIHSLEHGYIIISYNCNVHLKTVNGLRLASPIWAHEEEGIASSTALPAVTKEASGSAVNESGACKNLINQLQQLVQSKRLWKLILVPRPQLDTTLALTAWDYLDKFDPPAGGFDAKRIGRFIDYHRDQGPEKTME